MNGSELRPREVASLAKPRHVCTRGHPEKTYRIFGVYNGLSLNFKRNKGTRIAPPRFSSHSERQRRRLFSTGHGPEVLEEPRRSPLPGPRVESPREAQRISPLSLFFSSLIPARYTRGCIPPFDCNRHLATSFSLFGPERRRKCAFVMLSSCIFDYFNYLLINFIFATLFFSFQQIT